MRKSGWIYCEYVKGILPSVEVRRIAAGGGLETFLAQVGHDEDEAGNAAWEAGAGALGETEPE